MIDKEELVRRHNPILARPDFESPLTVGNGGFAFTADITGLQTLYDEYVIFPLCTMSEWGWHTEPAGAGKTYTLRDIEMTRYENEGKVYKYASESLPGNERVYEWLRHNPHRLNLARIKLLWRGNDIRSCDIKEAKQELDLYTGILKSEFTLFDNRIRVLTACAKSADVLGFSIEADNTVLECLSLDISFPYGSYRKNASDWQTSENCQTAVTQINETERLYERTVDGGKYWVLAAAGKGAFTYAFSQTPPERGWSFEEVSGDGALGWRDFWQGCGAADFSSCRDSRARELERRVILSQYLTAAQCAGNTPPQETGLSCNSWYGKFHLEMHILHTGYLPLWGQSAMLEKSFPWYLNILDKARENAARNGYKGARWPKMTSPDGYDSPSRIATLLIWQQPHIIYMLELARRSGHTRVTQKYWELVFETAEFMCDFVRFDNRTERYNLAPPLIPAQEEHKPEDVLNPAFELCYWRFGLQIAAAWAKEQGKPCEKWEDVLNRLADLPVSGGTYAAHQNCPDTFTGYNRDHPSMLYGFGFIPCGAADERVMSDTADKMTECWDKSTLWGWDFALTAMTFTRLKRPEDAIDVLLSDTPKNSYTVSGNNFQKGRDDLPLYLPGNGSLLLALAMMLAGYGDVTGLPGFPKNGLWDGIKFEGINPLPY